MKIIGHRGAPVLAPENTLLSLRKAVEHGVDRIEFDVRVSSEGVPVLHHDRLTGDEKNLNTLESALKEFGDFPLYIEVKPEEPLEPIIKLLKCHEPKDAWLASFSINMLQQLKEAFPDMPKVVLERWSGVRARRRADRLGTKLICMNQRWLWSGFIRAMSHAGYQLYAYPLNDKRKARRWAGLGLAGIVTDDPDILA